MGFPMLKVTPNLRTCRGCGSAIGVARWDLPPADVMSLVMNTDRSVAKRPQRGLIPSASPVVSATRQIPASRDWSGACSGSGHPDFRRKAPRPSLPELPCGRRIDPAERHRAPCCFKNPEEHLGRCRYVSICGTDPFFDSDRSRLPGPCSRSSSGRPRRASARVGSRSRWIGGSILPTGRGAQAERRTGSLCQ